MKKPRDMAGNDFVVACTYVAFQLFRAKYKRLPNEKCTRDKAMVRPLSEELYSVIMRHWGQWK